MIVSITASGIIYVCACMFSYNAWSISTFCLFVLIDIRLPVSDQALAYLRCDRILALVCSERYSLACVRCTIISAIVCSERFSCLSPCEISCYSCGCSFLSPCDISCCSRLIRYTLSPYDIICCFHLIICACLLVRLVAAIISSVVPVLSCLRVRLFSAAISSFGTFLSYLRVRLVADIISSVVPTLAYLYVRLVADLISSIVPCLHVILVDAIMSGDIIPRASLILNISCVAHSGSATLISSLLLSLRFSQSSLKS